MIVVKDLWCSSGFCLSLWDDCRRTVVCKEHLKLARLALVPLGSSFR